MSERTQPAFAVSDREARTWRRRGLVMDDVGVLLGHRDIKTTKRVYDHTTIYDVRKRIEELP